MWNNYYRRINPTAIEKEQTPINSRRLKPMEK